jgi:hypothetical protein
VPTVTGGAGVQSTLDVESSPVIGTSSAFSSPHVWTWAWFVIAIFVVLGFHIRMFGRPLPPTANFP